MRGERPDGEQFGSDAGHLARPADGDGDGDGNGKDFGHSAYDWYTRGVQLLEAGSPAAAAQLLSRAAQAEPTSRSILEALGRAQFEAGWYSAARQSFARIIDANPADDYAQFAMGLSAARTGDLRTAVEHLALAAAMRPDVAHYGRELRMVRARLGGAR